MRVNRKRLCQACAVELQVVESAWLVERRTRAELQPPRPPDSIDTFLVERCVERPDCSVDAYELYRAYKGWCDRVGERAWQNQTFHRKLTVRGIARRDSAGQRAGIALLEGVQ